MLSSLSRIAAVFFPPPAPIPEWVDKPVRAGFYTTWKKGVGLGHIYCAGGDLPPTFITEPGTKYYGPFHLPT